jgi:hypothetical protein
MQARLDVFVKSPAGRDMSEAHRARLHQMGYRVDSLVR